MACGSSWRSRSIQASMRCSGSIRHPVRTTIRNTADRLREALVGRSVEHVHSSLKKAGAEDWAGTLTGQLVRAVRSHGKNLFIDFEQDWTLYTHMLMWGAWHVYAQGEPWRK